VRYENLKAKMALITARPPSLRKKSKTYTNKQLCGLKSHQTGLRIW